jgi:hypothetical protein
VRAAGALWLLYAAYRAASDRSRALGWAATALFIYYLYFHGFSQSWYLIPLLPLAPFLPSELAPALRVYFISLSAYYALQIPLECATAPTAIALKELFEAAIVVLPASYVLLTRRGRASDTNGPRAA